MVDLTIAQSKAEDIPGWMTTEELAWLGDKASGFQNVVEVGCWQGRTSKMLAQVVKGRLFAVDSFKGDGLDQFPIHGDELQAAWLEHLATELKQGKATLIRGDSLTVAHTWNHGEQDMVFIDGDHVAPAPADDIQAWYPMVRSGGVLAGHDRDHPGVAEALAGMDYLSGPGSIWWSIKP